MYNERIKNRYEKIFHSKNHATLRFLFYLSALIVVLFNFNEYNCAAKHKIKEIIKTAQELNKEIEIICWYYRKKYIQVF